MTRIPTRAEIKSFHEEVLTKLALADMLAAADPDGPPLCMPLGQRSSEVGRYIIDHNLEPAVVQPLTAAQFDRLLEVVKLLHLLRKRTGRAMSDLVQRLAKFDNALIDQRSTAVATPEELEEIYSSVRAMLDEVLSVTEAKVADLVRMFDAACQRRIDEIDAALDKLQERRSDRGRPLN
jgi:hypothetical protein